MKIELTDTELDLIQSSLQGTHGEYCTHADDIPCDELKLCGKLEAIKNGKK